MVTYRNSKLEDCKLNCNQAFKWVSANELKQRNINLNNVQVFKNYVTFKMFLLVINQCLI